MAYGISQFDLLTKYDKYISRYLMSPQLQKHLTSQACKDKLTSISYLPILYRTDVYKYELFYCCIIKRSTALSSLVDSELSFNNFFAMYILLF